MNFYLIGIDDKKASIDIRETVYWKRKEIAEFWARHSTHKTAILSTCSRFEIYGTAENIFETGVIIDIFKDRFSPLFDNAYCLYHSQDVFAHLTSVAAGLESRIRGELQIYSQISAWASQDRFPAELSTLAHEALLAAHDIRMKNDLNRPENNIAVLVYDKILPRLHPDKLFNIAVAGTGKIAELFAFYRPQGVRVSFAAHKNILKAETLAKVASGMTLPLKDLPKILLEADMLVSATSSPHRVFDKNYFSKIAAVRDKELYIYDLGMPRDVAPNVKDISGIYLKNIDEVTSDVNFKNWHAAKPVSR